MNQDETIPSFEPTPKKTKYVLIVLVVGIMLFSCSVIGLYFFSMDPGITTAGPERFLGTWIAYNVHDEGFFSSTTSENYTMIFYSSGYVLYIYSGGLSNFTDSWKVEGDRLVTGCKSAGNPTICDLPPEEYTYSFTNDYKSLALTNLNPNTRYSSDIIHLEKQ